MAEFLGRLYMLLWSIYRPAYITLNVVIAIAYYYVFTYIVRFQNNGILLLSIPQWILYLLVATSSVLFTISIYSIRNTRRNNARISASALGTATTLAGGIIGGCGCSAPLVFSLTALGISAASITPLYLFLADNSTLLFSTMVLINLAVILYYLAKLSSPSCRVGHAARNKKVAVGRKR